MGLKHEEDRKGIIPQHDKCLNNHNFALITDVNKFA